MEYQEEPEADYVEEGLAEIAVGIGSCTEGDQINCVQFDLADECIWSGTASGILAQLSSPTLERFSVLPAHHNAVMDMRGIGSGVLSVSPTLLQLHRTGCAPHMVYREPNADLTAVHIESMGRRAIVGSAGGLVSFVDLATAVKGSTVDMGGKGVVALRGPLSRGNLVVGTADGCVSFLDARDGYRVGRTLLAHAGGLAAIDAHGDLLATCGYTAGRQGRLKLDLTVNIYDVRGAPRMVAGLPFTLGPSMLRFHPAFTSLLLVGATSGEFALMDAQGTDVVNGSSYHAVDTGGDGLICCDISPSGDCIAFGGTGGYVHLWSGSPAEEALIVPGGGGELGEIPEVPVSEATMDEDAPFSSIPSYFPADGWSYASYVERHEPMSVGLPPRVIDQSLLAGMKQSDFVGYIQNPKLKRNSTTGQGAAAVAYIRNQRLELTGDAQNAEELKAERARRRAQQGGIILPGRYRRVVIKQQTGAMKFEEFDFSFYNRTPFAGLENDLANCYTNALVQVLFFTQPMRDLVMQHAPDPATEFSLIGEFSFLFRMLATPGAKICQAANLLRALRQTREASVLGLLEGVKGERGQADIEVETHKDKSLSRRVQSLARFILEQLNKELVKLQQQQSLPPPPGVGAAIKGQHKNKTSAPTAVAGGVGGDAAVVTDIETLFAVSQRQRTQCLSRKRPHQEKSTRTFQIDLQYPESSGKDTAVEEGVDGGANNKDASSDASSNSTRPAFSQLLEKSLHMSSEMRAWFDEDTQYQYVRQERVPTALPKILVVNPGLQNKADLAWWQPLPLDASDTIAGAGVSRIQTPVTSPKKELPSSIEMGNADNAQEADDDDDADDNDMMEQSENNEKRSKRIKTRAWLPFAISVTSNPEDFQVTVKEGSTAEQLIQSGESAQQDAVHAVYELTAVIAHIMDEDEAAMGGNDYEGHLLAHIKVPPAYIDAATSSNTTTNALDTEDAVASTKTTASWTVFNDFHMTPCLPSEVTELYGGQKIPCLLYFTRVDLIKAVNEQPLAPPVEVCNSSAFLQLCRAPPLQGPRSRLLNKKARFVPLGPNEVPQKGTIMALDAEFVAYSPPEKVVRRGIEVEARPSRLGLARVSVVRGSGSGSGVCCIDDYIRNVEPVYDYLTRYSGLVPGDLDPSRSPHHLTTLRQAYIKLRYLVDAGCIFVGHGLRKDFRMINIVVPPEQVIDTLDLFYRAKSRRLSLRFLASYLLNANIQAETHDSIEDALTALKLYEVYRELEAKNKVEETIKEIYEWGMYNGWDPATWTRHPSAVDGDQQSISKEPEVSVSQQQKEQQQALARDQQQAQQLAAQLQQQQQSPAMLMARMLQQQQQQPPPPMQHHMGPPPPMTHMMMRPPPMLGMDPPRGPPPPMMMQQGPPPPGMGMHTQQQHMMRPPPPMMMGNPSQQQVQQHQQILEALAAGGLQLPPGLQFQPPPPGQGPPPRR